jgi:hypothetical protein
MRDASGVMLPHAHVMGSPPPPISRILSRFNVLSGVLRRVLKLLHVTSSAQTLSLAHLLHFGPRLMCSGVLKL